MIFFNLLIMFLALSIILINSVSVMDSSSDSEDFDWTKFLLDDPIDSPYHSIMPKSPGIEHTEANKPIENKHKFVKTPKSNKKPKELTKEEQERRKIAGRIRSKRHRDLQKIRIMEGKEEKKQPKPRKKISKEQARIYKSTYYSRTKAKIGFIQPDQARLHKLRILESQGKLSKEQEKTLFEHRMNNSLRTKKWREKKKLEQEQQKSNI